MKKVLLAAGALFVAFAALSSFRGTIVNSVWWVVTVVFVLPPAAFSSWPCEAA